MSNISRGAVSHARPRSGRDENSPTQVCPIRAAQRWETVFYIQTYFTVTLMTWAPETT